MAGHLPLHQRDVNLLPNLDSNPNRFDWNQINRGREPSPVSNEYSASESGDDDEHSSASVSDAESGITSSESGRVGCSSSPSSSSFGNNLVKKVDDDDKAHSFVKRLFLLGMGDLAKDTTIVGIFRNSYSSLSAKARIQAFRAYSDAVANKRGGNRNLKSAWYGASKDAICGILAHGFGQCGKPDGGAALFGSGINLSPATSSIGSVRSSAVDEDGVWHVLLCRVILGNAEEIRRGSKQFHPSSEEFDSGVDSLQSPKRYIVWSTHMNTHILPEFVVSVRAPLPPEGFQSVSLPELEKRPTSAWMPFPKLISLLSDVLPASTINLIKRYHSEYMSRRITRERLIRKIRQIAGDRLLVATIRAFRANKP